MRYVFMYIVFREKYLQRVYYVTFCIHSLLQILKCYWEYHKHPLCKSSCWYLLELPKTINPRQTKKNEKINKHVSKRFCKLQILMKIKQMCVVIKRSDTTSHSQNIQFNFISRRQGGTAILTPKSNDTELKKFDFS